MFVSRTIGQSLAKVLNSSALTLSMLLLVVLLAACDSSEERAEEHYESGLALMEEGDLDRALIEFRNVLQLNENHKDARLTYARIQRERGDIRDSYGQFLRVAEQYPDELEPRLALAEMALSGVDSTIPLFVDLIEEPDFQSGNYHIHWLENWLASKED